MVDCMGWSWSRDLRMPFFVERPLKPDFQLILATFENWVAAKVYLNWSQIQAVVFAEVWQGVYLEGKSTEKSRDQRYQYLNPELVFVESDWNNAATRQPCFVLVMFLRKSTQRKRTPKKTTIDLFHNGGQIKYSFVISASLASLRRANFKRILVSKWGQ